MTEPETFDGLKFLIQYRRKDDGVRWHNMAGFDVVGPAEKYFAQQSRDEDWPWEYSLLDLETGLRTSQCPQASEEPTNG
jgi:hypothetical protein